MRETLAGHHDYVAGDGRVKARCVLTNIADLVKVARATHLRFARALRGLAVAGSESETRRVQASRHLKDRQAMKAVLRCEQMS